MTALACSLVGTEQAVTVLPDTTAAALYGRTGRVIEDYTARTGSIRTTGRRWRRAACRISGLGDEGEVRIVELPGHPFFLATLFLPQMRSTAGRPHPLLAGYAAAVERAAMTPR